MWTTSLKRAKRRIQIILEEAQYQMLRELARKERTSLSSIIRSLLAEKLASLTAKDSGDPLYGIIGLGAGDGSTVARNHDRYLNSM